MDKKLEQHNSQSYHYEFIGFTEFKDVLKKLEQSLPYYRFAKAGKQQSSEVFYDLPSRLLSDSGIVLSKWIEKGKAYLNVRKIFTALNKPSQKFLFGECKLDEQPMDYSFQLASMIISSFSTPFSVDIESLVKQTRQFMQVDVDSLKYDIFCGTGFKAIMQYEDLIYKDLGSGKKIEGKGLTIKFPIEDRPEKEEIKQAIERNIKGIVLNEESRFEIARKALFSTSEENLDLSEELDDEDGEDEE